MPPILFVISLIAAGVWVVTFSHIALLLRSRMKWNRQRGIDLGHNEVAGDGQEKEPAQDIRGSASPDFAALIHAINTQGRANRAEEKREDDGKRFREHVTIILIASTLLALSWQVYEMVRVYGPITDQAEVLQKNLVASNRAWIEPSSLRLSKPLEQSGGLKVQLYIANKGKEPAVDIIYKFELLA